VAIPFALLVFADASQADPKAPWDGTWTGSWATRRTSKNYMIHALEKHLPTNIPFSKLCANEILAVDLSSARTDDFHAALRGHYDHPSQIADRMRS